jgi:hypothetical protein
MMKNRLIPVYTNSNKKAALLQVTLLLHLGAVVEVEGADGPTGTGRLQARDARLAGQRRDGRVDPPSVQPAGALAI